MLNQVSPDPVPIIESTQVPSAERNATLRLQRSLQSMNIYSDSFRAALRLFDFAGEQLSVHFSASLPNILSAVTDPPLGLDTAAQEALREVLDKQQLYTSWRNIACRDGAMSLYHFRKTMQFIRGNRDCTLMRSLVDAAYTRRAERNFDLVFPDIEGMRHAISHQGELWKGIAGYLKNTILNGYKSGSVEIEGECGLSSMCNGAQFSMTFEGRLVSFSMNEASLTRLIEIQNEFFSGFREAERKLRASGQ